MFFRKNSESITSKGLTVSKAVSMADLHRRRRETQSQYFTPVWVAKGIWKSLSGATDHARAKFRSLDVADTSCGSGRLFEGAPDDITTFYGADTDRSCIDALNRDATSAGVNAHFKAGSLADLDIDNMSITVINPPFSIQLDSPNLDFFDSNSYGKFGPGTSALSHEYALHQAVNGSSIVAALLPVSVDALARRFDRLIAIITLPIDTFTNEGANVKTAVYFFAEESYKGAVKEHTVNQGDDWPILDLSINSYRSRVRFSLNNHDESVKTIKTPVTGDHTVTLHHHNRRIVLKFQCGLVEAKVLNGLYQSIAVGKRLPLSIKYSGQGKLNLDVLLLQDNPSIQLELLAEKIKGLGGNPYITPNLSNFYKKIVNRHARAITPFYRDVKGTKSTTDVSLQALRRCVLDPENFSSPSLKKGQVLKATPQAGSYLITYQDYIVTLRRDQVLQRFEFISKSDIDNDKEWYNLHKGLNVAFPDLQRMHSERIKAKGIDWLADFQHASLTEGLISPYGYVGGWEQGSGKARYCIALALLHSGSSLISVEAGLLPEMILELKKLKISEDLWSVLKDKDMPTKKMSLVTYNVLRKGISINYYKTVKSHGSDKEKLISKIVRTNADRWKSLFNTVICDEGSLLSNGSTQQTKSVKRLCAQKLIILDGTPINNYPRGVLPLSVVSAGNGLAHQPCGVRGLPEINKSLINSCNHSQRGEDAFFDNHVVVQWVTNEFKDDLQNGGKREIPRINNLNLFREWLAPNIQRRLRLEPDLAIFNNCPVPVREVFTIDWDESHFGHYLKTSLEFAEWYKSTKDSGKALNMITVLARINAVRQAANSPHAESKLSVSQYMPLTSKQRFGIERIKKYVAEGRKVLFYGTNPLVLERIAHELNKTGIKNVLYTGKQDIKRRAEQLNSEFRYGNSQVLLSSWVGQKGLNLEQASAVIFYERNWSGTSEEQAIFRTQRPTQTELVIVEYLHLRGSIDEYCAQLVYWKLKACESGLDFGEGIGEDEEFVHLDSILSRFCEVILSMSTHEAKELYAA